MPLDLEQAAFELLQLELEDSLDELDPCASFYERYGFHRLTTFDKFSRAWLNAVETQRWDEWWERVYERLQQLPVEHAANKTAEFIKAKWSPHHLHEKQRAYFQDAHRFQILPAGRRSGKTALAKRKFVLKALGPQRFPSTWYIACAPTHGQAKRIYWNDFKSLIPPAFIQDKSEGELIIRLINGAMIQVMGMDVPERAEGKSLDGALLDEYGNMKPHVWGAHLRPALADRNGFAWFIGAPEGRNHYYDLWVDAAADEHEQWGRHTWTTEEILPLYLGREQAEIEIKSAKHDLDPLTYDQEYRASFVVFAGLVYYQFRQDLHAADHVPYSPTADLMLCFDFNVSPGVCVGVQESVRGSEVVGEVHIRENSNTPMVCRKVIEKWGNHGGDVYCYGDATGGARGTAKVDGSDWDLIKKTLKPVFGDRLKFRVPRENPPERVRVNSLNSRLMAADGTQRMWIDKRCTWLVKDLEGVRVIEGSAGEIDKDTDPRLTHISDALGYYTVKRFPIAGGTMMIGGY